MNYNQNINNHIFVLNTHNNINSPMNSPMNDNNTNINNSNFNIINRQFSNTCCCPSCGEPAGAKFKGSGEDYESFICLSCGEQQSVANYINAKYVMVFFVVNVHSIIIIITIKKKNKFK